MTIPNTYLQAMESPQADYWKEAMDKEFSSLIENCTWKLEKKPKNRKELKSKWVFDLKSDIRDIVTRFKARLCAVGSSQIHGIDFEETFSPTVRWESLRLFLSIAASKGATFFPHQMDVDTAFLYGDIDKEIFMKQPEGYGTNPENLSCLLLKSLYGLKQAGMLWNKTIDKALSEFGLERCEADPCIYVCKNLVLALSTDDILISGLIDEISKLKAFLCSKFSMKDLGEVESYLNVQFENNLEGIYISQTKYVKQILEETQMIDSNPTSTPMTKDLNDNSDPLPDPDMFRRIVCKLLYLSNVTRPDIAFSVHYLCRKFKNPSMTNFQQLKRILRYLKGSPDKGLQMFTESSTKNEFKCFVDADFASSPQSDPSDKIARKSTSGFAIFHNRNLISWNSSKQHNVALSTMESEYYALSDACKELLWIQRLFEQIQPKTDHSSIIYEDNMSCIQFIKRPGSFHKRSKHIDTRHHFVSDQFEKKFFALEHIPSNDNIADMFTKPLHAPTFSKLYEKICQITRD